MRKFYLGLIALALCIMLFSCTPTADMGFVSPDKGDSPSHTGANPQNAGFRDIIYAGLFSEGAFWKNWVFTSKAKLIDLESREVFSACSDPLCDHSGEGCAERVFLGADAILISKDSTQDDLILYIARSELVSIVDDHTVIQNHQLLRYHFYTGEVTVLAENLPGGNTSFGIDPQTDHIFMNQSLPNDAGENEWFLYIVNGKTGKMDVLPTPKMLLSVEYAIGDVVYCFDSESGGSYCIDLSQKELTIQETQMETAGVYGGYRYYGEKVEVQRVYVPDDVIPICEKYGKEPYQEFTKCDVYRVSILQEDAAPELVKAGVASFGVTENYIYYSDFVPQYLGSNFIATDPSKQGPERVKTYNIDDPDVPAGAALRNMFSADYAPLHIVDVVTLEEVAVIDSEEYCIVSETLDFMGNGVFAEFKKADHETHSMEKLTGYLYFNKPFLNETDLFAFDLSSDPGL